MSIDPNVIDVVLSGALLLLFGRAIIERRSVGRPLADGRVAAMQGEIAPTGIAQPVASVHNSKTTAELRQILARRHFYELCARPSSTLINNQDQ